MKIRWFIDFKYDVKSICKTCDRITDRISEKCNVLNMIFHKVKHRCAIWYLKSNKKYICETNICRLSLLRRREFNALTIDIWIHSTFHKFLISHCDLIDSIFMWFDCEKFKKYVNELKKIKNDREIDKKNNASNARQTSANIHRCKKCEFEFFDSD